MNHQYSLFAMYRVFYRLMSERGWQREGRYWHKGNWWVLAGPSFRRFIADKDLPPWCGLGGKR